MIKTTREFVGHKVDNRYAYDFGLCSSQGDWAQMDTAQDASWFGQWANPFARQILCYAEGDRTLIECSTDAEFTSELDRIAAFYRENDRWKGIDTWSVRIRERFAAAGARHLVHPSCFDMQNPEGAQNTREGNAPRSGTDAPAQVAAG
ncbi:MAG: hypothetical protein OXG72_01765 [Acidobacteria bacterium]|nr:hypothetical protein [Acidobacteriota bacterium]